MSTVKDIISTTTNKNKLQEETNRVFSEIFKDIEFENLNLKGIDEKKAIAAVEKATGTKRKWPGKGWGIFFPSSGANLSYYEDLYNKINPISCLALENGEFMVLVRDRYDSRYAKNKSKVIGVFYSTNFVEVMGDNFNELADGLDDKADTLYTIDGLLISKATKENIEKLKDYFSKQPKLPNKQFAAIKSQCKTPEQRKAFNRLIKSFGK